VPPSSRGAGVSELRPESKLPGAWVPAFSRSSASRPSGAGMTEDGRDVLTATPMVQLRALIHTNRDML
jgi:hypothetical protein